jgi:hypothetical protein
MPDRFVIWIRKKEEIMKTLLWDVVAVALIAMAGAWAAPTWETLTWNAVTVGGAPYVDQHYVEYPTLDNTRTTADPHRVDIVGNTTYPAAYWATDGQNLMFRMRLDAVPGLPPDAVWSAVLNTNGDALAEYVMQLDLKSHEQVEIIATISGGPANLWQDLAYVDAPHIGPTGGVPTDWYRAGAVTDGSNFVNNPVDTDSFVDFGFDLATLHTVTGMSPGSSFQVAFATSTSHVGSLKDLPDDGWSDPIMVPEPAALAVLLVLGGAALRRCRRNSA